MAAKRKVRPSKPPTRAAAVVELSSLSPVRKARAELVAAHLPVTLTTAARPGLNDASVLALTARQLERAVDDLATAGRARIERRGRDLVVYLEDWNIPW